MNGYLGFLSFGQLRAGVLSNNQVVERLADARSDLPAQFDDRLFGCRARHCIQTPGKQEALPRQWPGRFLLLLSLHIYAGLAQVLNQRAILLDLQPVVDALSNDGAYARNPNNFCLASSQQIVDVAKSTGNDLCSLFAYVTDIEPDEQAQEVAVFAGLDGSYHLICTPVLHAIQSQQLLAGQGIEVCNALDKSCADQLFTHLLTNSVDIHRTTRDKVNDAFEIARRAFLVWTIGHGLVWNA